jgi:hypothetical protein
MNMILASPRAKDLFQSFHKEIFSAVLKLEMSTRLQRIIHTVMIVRHHTPLNTTGPDELFRFHLDGDGQAQEIDFLPDPITTLRDTVHSANWIDFFVKSFVNSRIETPATTRVCRRLRHHPPSYTAFVAPSGVFSFTVISSMELTSLLMSRAIREPK